MAPIFVRKMLIFTQVQLSALISPSECAALNFALALLCTAAVRNNASAKFVAHSEGEMS